MLGRCSHTSNPSDALSDIVTPATPPLLTNSLWQLFVVEKYFTNTTQETKDFSAEKRNIMTQSTVIFLIAVSKWLERKRLKTSYIPKDITPLIWFLQLGSTSERFYHFTIMPSNYEPTDGLMYWWSLDPITSPKPCLWLCFIGSHAFNMLAFWRDGPP